MLVFAAAESLAPSFAHGFFGGSAGGSLFGELPQQLAQMPEHWQSWPIATQFHRLRVHCPKSPQPDYFSKIMGKCDVLLQAWVLEDI